MSDSFILQTYPFREADLVVSFFTRDQGKLRGVARRARRPKSNFGSGLERLSHATVSYYQKENRELVSLNSCELMQSQFTLASNYESSVALDYLAEITEQLLPPNETNERHFRLLIAVLNSLHAGRQSSGPPSPISRCGPCGWRACCPTCASAPIRAPSLKRCW